MKKTLISYLILFLAICAVGGGVYLWLRNHLPEEKEKITIEPGKIVDLRPIAELCAMEIYRETIVADTINGKVIYGIQKQQGRITFNIEDLPDKVYAASDTEGKISSDTLRLILPKEKVTVYESSQPNSWRVIDTKSVKLFGSSRMTPEEENKVKERAILRTKRGLYKDGTVKRARKEAASTLQQMASAMTGRPVIVTEE